MKFLQLIVIFHDDDYKERGGRSMDGIFSNYLAMTEKEIYDHLCDVTNDHIANYGIDLKGKLEDEFIQDGKIKHSIPFEKLRDLIPTITEGSYVSQVWEYKIQRIELVDGKFETDKKRKYSSSSSEAESD